MKIEILDEPEISLLREGLKKIRGRVTLATARHSKPKISHGVAIAILNDFVQHLFGLNIAFEKLPQLRLDEAYREVSSWLERDLAYQSEIMTHEDATAYLKRLFGQFQNPWFFSNRFGDGSWRAITKSTFDAALLIVDQHKAGILVIEDED